MQRNWIGKSQGARVKFAVSQMDGVALEVFTTRIDTIYGASALVISAGHPKLDELLDGVPGQGALERAIESDAAEKLARRGYRAAEKEGFFTGRFAVNPFSGAHIPIWVANFVLAEYGTGAVMCVPAHDERDYEFAEKYHLPVKIVVQPKTGVPLRIDRMNEAFTEYGRRGGFGSV